MQQSLERVNTYCGGHCGCSVIQASNCFRVEGLCLMLVLQDGIFFKRVVVGVSRKSIRWYQFAASINFNLLVCNFV